MMNLIQPLPVYDRINEQARFKENYTGMYDFICTSDRMIPFQIAIDPDTAVVTSVKLYNAFEGTFINIDLTINNVGKIQIAEDEDGKKWFLFYGDDFVYSDSGLQPIVIPCGYWFIEVIVDGTVYYTEVFKVVTAGSGELPNMFIEASHTRNMNGYYFEDNFKFRIFFNSFITNSTAETTDEFLKDGYERNILQRRVIQFFYHIEMDPLPNSIATGIIAMTAMKNFIINEIDGNQYVTKNVTVEQEALDGGFLDSIKITFTNFDQDIVATNC